MSAAAARAETANAPSLDPPLARIEKSPCGKFEFVHPEAKLKDKVTFVSSRGADPLTAADHHVNNMAFEFTDWVTDMRRQLGNAWQNFKNAPHDDSNRAELIAAVHVIKGNAPAIGYSNAGEIAGSLSRLFEQDAEWARSEKPIELCVCAIMATLSEKGKAESPLNLDILNAIAVMIERKLKKHPPSTSSTAKSEA